MGVSGARQFDGPRHGLCIGEVDIAQYGNAEKPDRLLAVNEQDQAGAASALDRGDGGAPPRLTEPPGDNRLQDQHQQRDPCEVESRHEIVPCGAARTW